MKLIAVLQEHGVVRPTEPARTSAFQLLVSKIYETDSK
jgi:hypothetical protein